MNTPAVCFAALACLATATAQGTLANANTSYELLELPDSPSADAPRISFTADAASASSVAYSFWWYYRVVGDSRESAFNSSNGQIVRNDFTGSVGTLEWDDVDGRGISATSLISLFSSGATAGTALHHMTVQNNTAGPITIELFAYCDIDHCGTAYGDNATGSMDRHIVSDPTCAGADAEFFGVLPQHYMVGNWPTVLDMLVDGTAGALPDTGLPYGVSADYTAAMQFTSPVLQPGERFFAVASISHGDSVTYCGSRASTRNYGTGVGGASGVPTITAETDAVVGSNLIFTIANAPPLAAGALFYGDSQILGDTGFSLWGLNFYVAVNVEPIGSDANGELRLQLNLPLSSNGLCGQRFHFHAMFNDATSPASPFPLVQSDVLEFTIGH